MRGVVEKIKEIDVNFSNLKTLEREIDSLRSGTMQRFSYVEEKIAAMHRQLAAGSERTEGDLIAMNDVMAVMNQRIAEIEEKIAELKNSDALEGVKTELLQAIEQDKNDRESLIEEIVGRTSRRMRNIVAKKTKAEVKIRMKKKKKKSRKAKITKITKIRKVAMKRKHRKILKKRKIARKIRSRRKIRGKIRGEIRSKIRGKIWNKITRAKINKRLIAKKLKKSEIENYGSALVVTERKSQKYGRAVFEAARKMNGNVVMIMQEKMSETDGFEPITYDAIDNAEAVFIVTSRKMMKNFAVRNAALKRRVFIVDRKLKFSEIKY